jgi:hypothetical protein
MSCGPYDREASFSELDQLLNKIPVDTEDLDLVSSDQNDSIREDESLTLEDKAQLFDEQDAKSDDLSNLLQFLTHRTREELDEELPASIALSDDILLEDRKVSFFDLIIPGFSYKTSDEKANIKRVSLMMALFAIVLVSSMALVVYGELSNVKLVSLQVSCFPLDFFFSLVNTISALSVISKSSVEEVVEQPSETMVKCYVPLHLCFQQRHK